MIIVRALESLLTLVHKTQFACIHPVCVESAILGLAHRRSLNTIETRFDYSNKGGDTP